MLAIRLQRVGRKGYAVYRIAVQEAQRHPSSGRVVAYVGSYNPHTKNVSVDSDKAGHYLKNGAQPTPRVVKLFKEQKIKLPDWVKSVDDKKQASTKKPEKLRKNQPAPVEAPEPKEETETAETQPEADEPAAEPAESTEEAPAQK